MLRTGNPSPTQWRWLLRRMKESFFIIWSPWPTSAWHAPGICNTEIDTRGRFFKSARSCRRADAARAIHMLQGRVQNSRVGARFHRLHREMAPPRAGTWEAIEKPQEMPCHRVKRNAFGKTRLDIGNESPDRRRSGNGHSLIEKKRIGIEEQRRVLVGGAPHHHAIDVIEFGAHLGECREAAVEHHGNIGKAPFQGMDESVIQRRKVAVLPRRQAFQPGFARMDNERVATGGDDAPGQKTERRLRVLFVDTRAALDGHWQSNPRSDGGDAIADKLRLAHQTSAESTAL